MTIDLAYSEQGLKNRSIFFNNEINIFVEDMDKEYLYEEIFKRLLGDNIKIEAIYPLGGKLKVIAEYIKNGPFDEDGIPNLFLLDGDFDRYSDFNIIKREDYKGEKDNDSEIIDFIKGKIIKSESVIYLKTYNIESNYIDEAAVVNLIKGFLQKKDSETKTILNYSFWREKIVEDARELFLTYCFITKYLNKYGYKYNGNISQLSIKTVNNSSFLFLNPTTGFKKDDSYLSDLQDKIKEALKIENPEINFHSEIEVIEKNTNPLMEMTTIT